ncbi:MAG: hypothetical protein NC191_04625 [Muribaculaceae bacterium]|nr:hypothetical protein [Muribaculaceae bacterium]
MSKQYQIEIQNIIDSEYAQIIKDIDKLALDAKKLRNKILQEGFNLEDYFNLTLLAEVCVSASDLDLYAKLMKTTQEKYLGIRYQPIGTDSTNPIGQYLYPYMKDNNIDRKKLIDIIDYKNKQIRIIEKYINDVEKLRP